MRLARRQLRKFILEEIEIQNEMFWPFSSKKQKQEDEERRADQLRKIQLANLKMRRALNPEEELFPQDEQEQENIAKYTYDLALLSQGVLSGSDLTQFINKSVELI